MRKTAVKESTKRKPISAEAALRQVRKLSGNKKAKQIPSFPNHFVTSCGRIYSKATGVVKEIVGSVHPNTGYTNISLRSSTGKIIRRSVHQIVARTFIGKRRSRSLHVVHLDNDPSNNHVSNLAYMTLKAKLKKQHAESLTPEFIAVVQEVKKQINRGEYSQHIAANLEVPISLVYGIKNRGYFSYILPKVTRAKSSKHTGGCRGLSRKQVEAMKKELANPNRKRSQREIANFYNVTESTVSEIKNGRKYADVEVATA